MTTENPTPSEEGGASTLSPVERIEKYLSQDAPVQELEEEIEQEAQPETKAEEPKQEEEPQVVEFQLSDVAKLLGTEESALDVDDAGNVLVKTKVDGIEGKAKFSDLLKSYQLQSYVDRQVRDAAEQRKALQAEEQKFKQEIAFQNEMLEKYAEIKSIQSEMAAYDGINWNELIDKNPVEALKYERQYRELQHKLQEKQLEVGRGREELTKAQMERYQAMLQREHQALVAAIPDWSDESKASKEKGAIVEELKRRGFSAEDISGLSDHRTVILARDAMLYRQQQAAKPITEKQVRAAPKIIKPGSAPSGDKNTKNIQNLKTAVVKSGGSKQSVVDYLLATGRA